ncbi:MAG: class I SAM-dependent methyltransferase [Anaerolineales bacterium]
MSLTLKPGREKSLLRRHPWVFASAVQSIEGNPASGETVEVYAAGGQFLARAAYSPQSQIRARVWTFEDKPVDADFFRAQIRAALRLRQITLNLKPPTDSYRLLHGESDGLAGFIVDRYNDTLVIQALSAGAEFWKQTVADVLLEETGAKHIYERSDADVRELEGLPPVVGVLRGSPEPQLTLTEYGLKFFVHVDTGHKTGFYLDQRENRRRVGQLAKDRDVLNCFCYTGGFSLHALANGAKSVLSVDSSADALALLEENLNLNKLNDGRNVSMEGDVFQLLRKFRDANRSFDMMILDPPKFAPTAAHAEKAARAYKDINLLACKLLRVGGILATFSCSGGVDAALFQKIVASAALDAGAEVSIIGHFSQGADHPVSVHFPEGAYLKGLLCVKR